MPTAPTRQGVRHCALRIPHWMDSPMYITLDAGRQIRKLLEKQGMPEGGLRVGVKAGGCSGLSYVFAWEPAPGQQDQVFDGPEDSKIYVDPKSFKFLEGTQLDYDTSLISKGFVINNPKAKATCGCGTSFSLS
jgi:iron-sulfur cluster assembly protein